MRAPGNRATKSVLDSFRTIGLKVLSRHQIGFSRGRRNNSPARKAFQKKFNSRPVAPTNERPQTDVMTFTSLKRAGTAGAAMRFEWAPLNVGRHAFNRNPFPRDGFG
jgi:hypothetical protein